MAEQPGWWVNRLGQAGGATVTAAQPEPVYGLAADLAQTPMSRSAFRGAVGEISTFAQDQNVQRGYAQQELRQTPPTLAEIRDHIRFQLEQIDDDPNLSPGEKRILKRQNEAELIRNVVDNAHRYGLDDEQVEDLTTALALNEDKPGPLGTVWNHLSGADEETGLNRTERKWLQAQAEQDSDISFQEDATLRPGLRGAARNTLDSGEWTEELATAYAEYQDNFLKRPLVKGLEWYDKNVHEPVVENISAGVIALDSWGDHASDMEGKSWSEIWRESRDAANNVSFGQAFVDAITQDPDTNREAYRDGFDEFGNPLNQAYFDRRQGSGYNVASGLTDFSLTWYADPLVIAGKAGAATRALTRADIRAMPAPIRDRFLTIATMPSDELARVGTRAHPYMNPVDALALRARKAREEVRDQIRAGTLTERELAQRAPFKDDPIATQFFVKSALAKRVDPSGRLDDAGWNDDAFDLFTAASYGHGPALTQLAQMGDDFNDLAKALEPRVVSVEQDILRLEDELDTALEGTVQNGFDNFEAWRRVHEARFDLERAVDERSLLANEMDEYDSYHDVTQRFLESPDKPTLRNARWQDTRRTISLRTSVMNANGVLVTDYPKALWRKRPGNADLTRGSETVEAARRYGDQMGVYGSADSLTATADRRGFGSWEELQHDFQQRLLTSTSDTERRRIMGDFEEVGVEIIATKHGITPDDAVRIANQHKLKRNQLMAMIERQKEERLRAAAAGEEPPSSIFSIADGETLDITKLPMDPTELKNYYVPTDLRTLDSFLKIHGDAVRTDLSLAGRVAGELGTEVLEKFNAYWKPAVLLRLGYPMRNIADGQLRILALTGSFATAGSAAGAAAIGTINTGSRVLNAFPRLAGLKGRIPMVAQPGQKAGATIKVGSREWAASQARQEADVFLALNSSDDAQRSLYRRDLASGRAALSDLRATREGEPGHVGAWAKVLNDRITKSPIWNRMLAGESDDDIIRWLNGTTEGKAVKRRLPWRSYDPTRWVDELRVQLDTYVPDDILRAKLAAGQPVDESMLQKMVDEGAQSPVTIDEAALAMQDGESALGRWVGEKIDAGFRLLATIPEDTLVRNPFFRNQYRGRLSQSTAHIPASAQLTPAQIRALKQDARQFALSQTRRYLFTLADQNDLTHFFRFLAPFGAAAMEAMRKWGRIAFEEPEAFARLYVNGWADLDDAAFWELTDQSGNTAEEGADASELEYVRMQVSSDLAKKLLPDEWVDIFAPGNENLEVPAGATPAERDAILKQRQGQIGATISKRSMNVSLQGDPWYIPGVGPWVQIPVGFAAKKYPELADDKGFRGMIYRYIYPTGVPDVADVLFPAAYMRAARRAVLGTEDPVFTNMADNLAKSQYYEWVSNGKQGPRPNPDDALDQAKGMQSIYTVARFGTPFAFQIQSPGQYFIDAARNYQDQYGYEEGFAKFVKDYGTDAQIWWTSNSDTIVEVPPTSRGHKANKQYRDLINEHPELALAIVGLEVGEDPFNYAVYAAQQDTPATPGSRDKMRERLGPEEAIAKAEAGMGWNEWREVNTAITAELAARGLTSTAQAGAEDLELLKYNAREAIKDKYPGWAEEQALLDKDRTYRMVDGLREILLDGRAPIRPDWEGIAEYVEIHDLVAAELDARQQAGGSPDLGAASNRDMKQVYDNAVGQLMERNLRFHDLFLRLGLDSHSLSNGSN